MTQAGLTATALLATTAIMSLYTIAKRLRLLKKRHNVYQVLSMLVLVYCVVASFGSIILLLCGADTRIILFDVFLMFGVIVGINLNDAGM